jgi:heme/copper-type cytochrome/quinol oxidase subunit 3
MRNHARYAGFFGVPHHMRRARTALESSLLPTARELEMTSTGFWFVIGATAAMFALWLAANIFLVAREGATEIVPLSTRPNWRARVNAAMLMLPVVAGLGAALLH